MPTKSRLFMTFFKAMKFRTNTMLCMEITTWRAELCISHIVFSNGTKMKSCVLFILLFPGLFVLALRRHTVGNSNLQQYFALLYHLPQKDAQRDKHGYTEPPNPILE